jgi:hypothetical protein
MPNKMKLFTSIRLIKWSVILTGSLFLFVSSRPVSMQELYIEQYKWVAIREMERSGIPASIKMAQALLESGSGKSELAKNANNHFGIKCKKDWTGGMYYYRDDDKDKEGNLIESCFRLYPDVLDSYRDHSDFLVNRPRYKELFSLDKTDYISWAQGLKRCGYATDPNYADLLIKTVKKYNLDNLDYIGNSNASVTETKKDSVVEIRVDKPVSPIVTKNAGISIPKSIPKNLVKTTQKSVQKHKRKRRN